MRYTTYRYNTETCHFERVRPKAGNVISYALGLVFTASGLVACMLLLHNALSNTDSEKELRKENKALKLHHKILSAELNDLQPMLTSLENKDRMLHKKFFGSAAAPAPENPDETSKEKFLLATPRAFRKQVSSLNAVTAQLLTRASRTNNYFANKFYLEKDKVSSISCVPTRQPITPWQGEQLLSGFGMRVNPFHKGLYQHPGVDVAMARGTPVIATAPGIVHELKRSDLQAGYGNYIEIDHGHGWVSRYAHLEDIKVKYGEKVSKGQTIGTVGSSGGSVAPHLHYEILRDGKNVDPVSYMIEGLTSDEYHRLAFRSHQQNQSLD